MFVLDDGKKNKQILTHLFSMHPFSTSWKYHLMVFWYFQGVQWKGLVGTIGLNEDWKFTRNLEGDV